MSTIGKNTTQFNYQWLLIFTSQAKASSVVCKKYIIIVLIVKETKW